MGGPPDPREARSEDKLHDPPIQGWCLLPGMAGSEASHGDLGDHDEQLTSRSHMLDGGAAAKASSPACFSNGARTILKMRSRVAMSPRSSTARIAVSATQLRRTYLGLMSASPPRSSPSVRTR